MKASSKETKRGLVLRINPRPSDIEKCQLVVTRGKTLTEKSRRCFAPKFATNSFTLRQELRQLACRFPGRVEKASFTDRGEALQYYRNLGLIKHSVRG